MDDTREPIRTWEEWTLTSRAEKNLRARYPGLSWGAGKLVYGGGAAWARRALNT